MLTMRNFASNGRLGNQLFQLASLSGIAEKTGHKCILKQWKHSDLFDVNIEFGKEPIISIDRKETKFHFSMDQFYNLDPNKNYNITGYLQSEKYFGENKLRFKSTTEFAFNNVSKFFKNIKRPNFGTVGVHVRRGDYVNHPYYYELPYIYYFKALTKKIPNLHEKRIMIFSDDIEYCKKVFPNTENIQFVEGNSDIEDLFLLSMCNYHILSNSTFGWWGAYLSESKKVVYPAYYFAGKGLVNNTKDFWPENWEKFDHNES